MRILVVAAVAAGIGPIAAADPEQPGFGMARFAPDRRAQQVEFEKALNAAPTPESLKRHHELLASEPHCSGSEGDQRVIELLEREFTDLGLEVQTHWIWVYLSRPISASLAIIEPEPLELSLTEPAVEGDPFSSRPGLGFGWNAYSGSGDVTGEVVYANYGRKEDFARLKELGVDAAGKIVVVRYGKNFRGFKAKFAQEAGAAGLIIYTDPADSGYMRGLMYPEGGYATDRQIERGCISTLPYPGDPLTPGSPATEKAPRLDPAKVDLPKIPVQPASWSAAKEIMQRMTGPGVPEEWQGAMPLSYRLSGGPALKVHLSVRQERAIVKTANVIGALKGSKYPAETIIVGCHHDAWVFGAADPLAGLILVLESARSYAQQAKLGNKPERTLVFAAWAAEEHGIVGSTEWVEAYETDLLTNAVAYINLDMASMGPLFNSSGAPTLRRLVIDATRDVPLARDPSRTVFQEWLARDPDPSDKARPRLGSLGGGSDHIGFYFHDGIPSISLAASGGRGTSYHSNYDNLHWYQQVVGADYEPAVMLTRVLNVVTARLARADILPIDPAAYAPDLKKHADDLEKIARDRGVDVDLGPLRLAAEAFGASAGAAVEAVTSRLQARVLTRAHLDQINSFALRRLERLWLVQEGIPGRPWYRSLYLAPDEDSGYSAWPLPGVRAAVERKDPAAARAAVQALADKLVAMEGLMARLKMMMEVPSVMQPSQVPAGP